MLLVKIAQGKRFITIRFYKSPPRLLSASSKAFDVTVFGLSDEIKILAINRVKLTKNTSFSMNY